MASLDDLDHFTQRHKLFKSVVIDQRPHRKCVRSVSLFSSERFPETLAEGDTGLVPGSWPDGDNKKN